MFTDDFLKGRRVAFADQLCKALYTYTSAKTGETDVRQAYFRDREVNGNVILLTFNIISSEEVSETHTIDTIYLMYSNEDLEEILNMTDVTAKIAATQGKALGSFDVNTSINGHQSFAVRVRIQYKEVSGGITDEDTKDNGVSPTSAVDVTHIPWEE